MRNNKILLITIIVVVVLILITGSSIFAYTYFKTDIFKTDEQLFYKYISEFSKSVEKIKSDRVINYLEKLNETPYENKGKVSVKVEFPELEESKAVNLNTVNRFNITLSGKVDKQNKAVEQSVKLNYSDNVVFPIEYKQIGDIYGITSELIVKQYIAVRNQNLQDEDKYKEILRVAEQKQEIKRILENSKKMLLENVKETNFLKIDEENYAMILNEKETSVIILKILEELKSSEITSENMKKEIQQRQEEIQNKEYTDEEALRIVINKTGKLSIIVKDRLTLNIQSTDTGLIIEPKVEGRNDIIVIKIRKNRNSK